MMSLVALSIAVLLAAPLLAAALLRRPALAAGLDGFVLVAVGGIVALHVVPQSAHLAGPMAIAFAAARLFLPIAIHRHPSPRCCGPARTNRVMVRASHVQEPVQEERHDIETSRRDHRDAYYRGRPERLPCLPRSTAHPRAGAPLRLD